MIAILKLRVLQDVLKKGISIFVVDLDVGFLHNPITTIQNTLKISPEIEVLLQKDITFSMAQAPHLYLTWTTSRVLNIGIMFTKSSPNTILAYDKAWNDYWSSTSFRRGQPGFDQQFLGSFISK